MSTEIFEANLQQQTYNHIDNPSTASPVFSIRRRIACLVGVFVICVVAALTPSLALVAPFSREDRAINKAAAGIKIGSDSTTTSTSAAVIRMTPAEKADAKNNEQLALLEDDGLAVEAANLNLQRQLDAKGANHNGNRRRIAHGDSLAQQIYLRLLAQQEKTKQPLQRIRAKCLAMLHLVRDEVLVSDGFSWISRPGAHITPQTVNGTTPPELYAPLPHWKATLGVDAGNTRDLLQNRFLERAPDCRQASQHFLPSLITALADDLHKRRNRRSRAQHAIPRRELFESMPSPPSTVFSQRDAWECLADKKILFIGTSNTRTLMTNLQARLENAPQMSRVAAKQMCDDSTNNHACSVTVSAAQFFTGFYSADSNVERTSTVQLEYVGYKEDLVANSPAAAAAFARRMENADAPNADFIVMSTGINSIQNSPWSVGREAKMPRLQQWVDRMVNSMTAASGGGEDDPAKKRKLAKKAPRRTFIWHSVSPLCQNMPHFKRYRFRKSAWNGQTIDAVNDAVFRANKQVRGEIDTFPGLRWEPHVRHIDSDLLLSDKSFAADPEQRDSARRSYAELESRIADKSSTSALRPKEYCRFYEDPLHHRFLDRAIVDALLTMIC